MLEINTNFQKQRLVKPSRNQANETASKKTVSQISEGLSAESSNYVPSAVYPDDKTKTIDLHVRVLQICAYQTEHLRLEPTKLLKKMAKPTSHA